MNAPLPTKESAVQSARKVGLRYVNDGARGFRRKRIGKAFRYIDVDGCTIRDQATLARIKALVIPPAWADVWICTVADGHLQVTGRDANRRKQYRYHVLWRKVRDENKYGHLIAFGNALPSIREQVEKDITLPKLPREKILATVVRLLEATMIRVGNEEYVRSNGSFGLTTLRSKHVRIDGSRLEFRFRGKSGIEHFVALSDARLARIVRRCRDLPGYELFQYLDDDGSARTITSDDVNDYLRRISGQNFTAKDFRTWAGTLLAALALREFETFESESQAKGNLVQAVKVVASRLGNTPAICRKCYIHPTVIESYLEGSLQKYLRRRCANEAAALDGERFDVHEASLLALLEKWPQRRGRKRLSTPPDQKREAACSKPKLQSHAGSRPGELPRERVQRRNDYRTVDTL